MNYKSFITPSIAAGFFIGLASWMYVSIANPIIGAILFALGLLMVVKTGSYLFTGKVGSIPVYPTGYRDLLVILGFNLVGILAIALVAGTLIDMSSVSRLIEVRNTTPWHSFFGKGIGCGILMEVAVWYYRKFQSPIGLFLAVPAFIFSGFFHCIADSFYMMVGYSYVSVHALVGWVFTVLGNWAGAQWRTLLDIE